MSQETQNLGLRIGYRRVSTTDQTTARQLADEVLDRVFEDQLSGKNVERPGLAEMMRFARAGDTVIVHSLDRLGRNVADLKRLVGELNAKGVTVTFRKENMTFTPGDTNPMGQLLFHLLAAFAEFERELIRERQREGIAIAKAKGIYKGRRPTVRTTVDEIRIRIAAGESAALVARALGVSRQTVYKYATDLGAVERKEQKTAQQQELDGLREREKILVAELATAKAAEDATSIAATESLLEAVKARINALSLAILRTEQPRTC